MSTNPETLLQNDYVTVRCEGQPPFFDITYSTLTEDWSDEDVRDFLHDLDELTREHKPSRVLFDQTHYRAVLSEENNRLAADLITKAFIECGLTKCAIYLAEDLFARMSTRYAADQSEAQGATAHYPIRFFDSREEALRWLFEDEDVADPE